MGRNIENENPQKRKGMDIGMAADEIIDVLYKYGIKISLMDAVFKIIQL